ncbi:MAG: hypothetical protein AAB262_04235, partial [Elusimicrobiota bacterium]
LASLATRKAVKEGLTGQARADRVADIIANIGFHPEVYDEAEELARRLVYQETRSFGKKLSGIGQHPIVNVFVPFVK